MELKQGYKQTEVGIVPQDWGLIKLENNFTLKARIGWQGLTTKEYLASGNYSLVTGTDFHDGYINWESCVFVERMRFDQDKNIQLKVGDVLVTKDGTIGKVAYVDRLPNPTTLNSGVFVLRPKNNIVNNRFFYNILMSFYFDEFLNKITAGSTITHLYQKDFIHFNFILPPLPEQTAIANALSDMDALIAQTEKLIEKKKAIKQGAMQELLKPKEDWVKKKLGELFKYEQPTDYIVSDTEYHPNNEIPVLTAGKSFILGFTNETNNIFENTPVVIFDDFTTSCQYVDFRFKVKSSAMKILKPANDQVNMRFAFEILKNIKYQVGDHKRHWIGEFVNFDVIVPKKIEEQNRIGQIIEEFELEQHCYQTKLNKLKQQKQGMMQALLTGKIRLVS